MTEIYLVRHAKSMANLLDLWVGTTDSPLCLEGYEQVKDLTERIKDIPFFKIYSSPLTRAQETVKQIAFFQNKDILLENDLREMNFGVFEGLTTEQVKEQYPNINMVKDEYLFSKKIPNQETFEEVQERVVALITALAQENDGKRILISSHYVALKAFLSYVLNIPLESFNDQIHLSNTSLNILSYHPETNQFEAIQLSSE